MDSFRAHAFPTGPDHADDRNAVILGYGRMVINLSIAEARELSHALAVAADDAELNLPPLPAQQCAQEQDGEYSREDDPNFNEAMTGDLLAQAEYWDAVARQGGRSDE